MVSNAGQNTVEEHLMMRFTFSQTLINIKDIKVVLSQNAVG